MYRSLFFVMVLLLAVGPAYADSGKKLTNAELKELTSNMLFSAGYTTAWNVSYHATWFRDGTREVYWNNGASGHVEKGKWWLKGDTVCLLNESWTMERCVEWRKNGDRIETWGKAAMNGYFYILR